MKAVKKVVSNVLDILSRVEEIRATTDSKEAALLLQSGNWFAFGAAFKGDEIEWALGRITSQSSQILAELAARGVPGALGLPHTTPAQSAASDGSIQAVACHTRSCSD